MSETASILYWLTTELVYRPLVLERSHSMEFVLNNSSNASKSPLDK